MTPAITVWGFLLNKHMKINKIIYDIRTAIRDTVDDQRFSDRYLIHLYNLKRSKYLRNDANNLQKLIDNSILQKFCMDMEEVSVNECGLDYDCDTIMRSKTIIPIPLELHLKSAITEVKPTVKISKPFNFVNKERAIWSQYSPFAESIYAFLDTDKYLYLISKSETVKLIDCITVTGIFEDPLELQNYKNCCGCEEPKSCFDIDDTEYPLQSHHIDSIRGEIIQTLVGSLKLPQDEINNAND
jgi:hypothetical protein